MLPALRRRTTNRQPPPCRFLHGQLNGLPLERCCEIACAAGAAVLRIAGGELSPADWRLLRERLGGDVGPAVRRSPGLLQEELSGGFSLVERLGRGVVYFGSARFGPGSRYWQRAFDLSGQVRGASLQQHAGVMCWA